MMSHDEIDRILSDEEELLPSSGFASSVMDAVRREAAAPPPIPFPWKRALPGLVVAAMTLVFAAWVSVLVAQQAGGQSLDWRVSGLWTSPLRALIGNGTSPAATWTIAALVLAAVSVMFSWRSQRG
jgi:hypothetical protein